MKTRPLARTEMAITPLGLGTWAMGAGKRGTSNLGSSDDAESVAALRRGVDLGINWVDTAAYYGFGHAERLVARAFRGASQRPYIFTKCGLIPARRGLEAHAFCLKAESVRGEVESSLRRLETDSIDMVMLHWPIPDSDVEEGWSALAELKREGKVRHIGVSNFSSEQLARCERIAPVQAVQPEYSLADRTAEKDVFPYLEQHGIGAIVYSPLKHGILSGGMTEERIAALSPTDWRRGHEQYTEPRLSRNLSIVKVLRAIGQRHQRSVAEVAVAWTLCRPPVAGAIIGARRPSQVDAIAKAAEIRLSPEDQALLTVASLLA